jgi:hypothetical protein
MQIDRLAIPAMALMLTGCFGMQQDIVVSDDGNTTMSTAIHVDAALIAMSSQGKPDNFCKQLDAGKLPPELKANVTRTTDKADIVCTINVTGPTERVFAAIKDGSYLPPTEKAADPGNELKISVTDVGGNKRLAIEIPPPPAKAQSDDRMQSMMLGAVAGRFIQWNFTAPTILETSGTLSDDRKTASFSVPVATLMSNRTETLAFSVTFSDEPPGIVERVKGWFR